MIIEIGRDFEMEANRIGRTEKEGEREGERDTVIEEG
jgi:hypothetical protein